MAREKTTSEQELAELRAKVAQLESEKEQSIRDGVQGVNYLKELQELKKKKGKGLNEIQTKEIYDVKYISLWHVSGHNIGKRVGPIHPDLAEDTFILFANKGIKLSLHKPTEEYIESYKLTTEYKTAADKERKRRDQKANSLKDGEVQKVTKAIAKMIGKDPAGLNQIVQPEEVTPVRQ